MILRHCESLRWGRQPTCLARITMLFAEVVSIQLGFQS